MTLPLFFILCIFVGYTGTWFYYLRMDKKVQRQKEIDAWMKGEGDTK